MTKYHRLTGFNNTKLISHSLEAGSPRSRGQPVWVLGRISSWHGDRQFLDASSYGRGSVCSSCVSYETTRLDQGPTPMTSFNLNYLCKGLQIQSHRGLGLHSVNFVGTHSVHNTCLHRKNEGRQCIVTYTHGDRM